MVDSPLLVIVDADTLAGWRRPTSSLRQLHDAVEALERQEPDAVIAVIADASLKWALSEDERDLVEADIVRGSLLFAPAGCVGGLGGFIGRVVDKARERGFQPFVVTDQAITGCPLARARKGAEGEWVFDLETATTPPSRLEEASRLRNTHRRRRR